MGQDSVTVNKFIELIQRSELLPPERLEEFLAGTNAPLEGPPQQLSEAMIEAGLITQWQADHLLRGKYRGFRLGKYTLLDHLGSGGMSSVYLSRHPVMKRNVAIKVLPQKNVASPGYLQRFLRESQAAASLDHPNIVRAYDIDHDGDVHYLVMEYVQGRDLQKVVTEEGPLDYDHAADYIGQAALGLQHAHDAGLIHRDVKPANCLLDPNGIVKVLDLGLAKFSGEDSSLSMEHNDSVVGTADYLAPEQAINSQTVDHRADVYGLGCTLYFLLTGHPPFPEGTLTQRLMKHQREEPASLYQARPDIPAVLVDICHRMMRKKRSERIQTAAAVAEEIRSWLQGRGIQMGCGILKSSGDSPAGGSGDSGSLGGQRWKELERRTKEGSGSGSGRQSTSDTISSREGDTNSIGSEQSSINDDLTLAPLDEDEAAGNRSISTASSESNVLQSGTPVGRGSSAGHSSTRSGGATRPRGATGGADSQVSGKSSLKLTDQHAADGSSPLQADLSGADSSSSIADLLDEASVEESQPMPIPPPAKGNDVPAWIWWTLGLGSILLLVIVALVAATASGP